MFYYQYALIYRDVSKDETKDSVDEDEESSSDGDDDGSTDNDEGRRAVKPPPQSDPRTYTVLCDFKGEQEGDLSVQVKYFMFQKQ